MSTDLSSEALMARLAGPNPPMVIDVRKAEAFAADPVMIPEAVRRDPFTLSEWSGALPRGRELVVYCVHGHEVSRDARNALRGRGFMAVLLAGGLEGWKAAGGPVVPAAQQDEP